MSDDVDDDDCDHDDDDHDHGDIYIMKQCLFVCLSRKMSTSSFESPLTTCNHPVQLRVSFHGFSQFQIGFSWFQVGFYGFSWFQVGFYGARSVFMFFLWFLVGFSFFTIKTP